MARAEGEPSFKEKAKKYGAIAAVAGGAILLISSSGLGLALFLGGGGTYAGAKYLENRSEKHK